MIIQGAIAVVLGALFIALASYNGLIFITERRGGHAPSVAPLVGGLSGAAALWVWPYHEPGLWAFLPVVLDYGCAPYLTVGAFLEVRRAWRYREKRCVGRLFGESEDKRVEIKLYTGGRLLFEETFKNPTRLGSFSAAGTWTASEATNGYILKIWEASISLQETDGHWVVARETGWFREELRISPITLSRLAADRSLERPR